MLNNLSDEEQTVHLSLPGSMNPEKLVDLVSKEEITPVGFTANGKSTFVLSPYQFVWLVSD